MSFVQCGSFYDKQSQLQVAALSPLSSNVNPFTDVGIHILQLTIAGALPQHQVLLQSESVLQGADEFFLEEVVGEGVGDGVGDGVEVGVGEGVGEGVEVGVEEDVELPLEYKKVVLK